MKKENEIIVLNYFMPKSIRHIEISDADRLKYFEWSEMGLHKEDVQDSHFDDGFNALVSAKRWAGRTMEMYEDGILSGDTPYYILLEDVPPRPVVEFMKKELFRGADSDLIEKLYNEILNEAI